MREPSEPNLNLVLSLEDARVLEHHVLRRVRDVELELVRTDNPTMQHELAADLNRLSALAARITSVVAVARAA